MPSVVLLCAAVRRGHVLVELEEAGAVAGDEEVDADLAEVAAELEGVRADELRVAGVGAGRLPVDSVGLIAPSVRAELVVAADRPLRELRTPV